jgi:hypothetical protein
LCQKADGSIDVAKADAAWEANTDHTKRHDPAAMKDIDPNAAMESVRQTLAENGRAAHRHEQLYPSPHRA